jgi:chitinase
MRTSLRFVLLGALASLVWPVVALPGAPLYTISVQVAPTGGGTVTLDPTKDGYAKNNIVTVSATPAKDMVFTGWGGALSGTQNPATLRVSGNHTVIANFGTGSGSGGGSDPPPPSGVLPAQGMVVGYFAQWTIYRRGYLPKHVAESGAVQQMNVMNYAFAAPDASLKCASLDTFADYGKRYDASESVDGVADTVAQPLKGNFNQILKLKKLNPGLRVLISLGGWTESYRFSDAALPGNRAAFVASCIDMFIEGNVAAGISAAGVFDGIDVDWEYPGSCGATCDYRETDKENFVALLAEFRRQLTAFGAKNDRQYLLTIAAPAGATHYEKMELAGIAANVDWINVMAYDFHGAWETAGPTNHISALFQSSCEQSDGGDWADKAIQAYIDAPADPNPAKLVLGMPFYGHGWRTAAVGDGFCQAATGVPRGKYEKGTDDYEVLAARNAQAFRDEATGTHWTFDGSTFWSFDDPVSASWKADYANCRGLRGVMFWELSGDDPQGGLLTSMSSRLKSGDAGCRAAWSQPVPALTEPSAR